MFSVNVLIFFLLAILAARPGDGLNILEVSLVGGRGEDYINVGSGGKYVLACSYRSGYDDPVVRVRWLLYGSPVYVWTANSNSPSASGPLLGLVDTFATDEPHNLHFTSLQYALAGNYTCEVSSVSTTVTSTYDLHVVDVSPLAYETSVQVLSEIAKTEGMNDDAKYIVYDTGESDIATSPATVVEFEEAECTLVWGFRSPAIFPRPNITCGYYSFNHDDVVHRLPAGLTMHQFSNGSWQASFEDTHVQVASIPVNHRLACSVRIPSTSYRELVMSREDFNVDNLIDEVGCPRLDLPGSPGMLIEVVDVTSTCRGNLLSSDRDTPVVAKLSCPAGHGAVFPDGMMEPDWRLEISCVEYELFWRSYVTADQPTLGEIIDLEMLPYCDPGASGSPRMVVNSLVILASFSLLFTMSLIP